MKRIVIFGILLLCAAGSVWFLENESAVSASLTQEKNSEADTPTTDDTDQTQSFNSNSVVIRLVKAGWPQNVAERVVNQNFRRYDLLHGDAPTELGKELAILARLKVDADVAAILEKDPSLAGLLCLAPQPDLVAQSLLLQQPGTEHYERIKGTFVIRIDMWEIDRWAKVLARHGKLVGKLIEGGIVQPDAFFAYTVDNSEASKAYGEWLEQMFGGWPDAISDKTFGLHCAYVANFGSAIYERMKRDGAFRSRFASEVWPILVRLSDEDPGIFFFPEECGVWDLILQREDAERLLQRAGTSAAEILAGERAVPERVREEVAQYLLLSDWRMIDWIERYRNEPAVISMIERDAIGPEYLPSVFERLDARGASYPEELEYLSRLNNGPLLDELKPIDPGAIAWVPGYSTYALLRKSAQGQRIDGMDWFGAGMDVVSIIPILTPVKGGKLAIQKLVNEAGKDAVESTTKKVAQELGERAAKEIAKAAEERQLTSVFANKVLGALSKETREFILSQGQIEITEIVQKTFGLAKNLNLSRESFKKLTNLDARIFMRKNGRVYVSLPELVAGQTESAKFINEVALAISEAGAAQSVVAGVNAYGEQVAAWWLAHASGNLGSPTL